VLIIHVYLCILFGVHGTNVGLGIAYFGAIGILLGIVPDVFLMWRFIKLRREQKMKEDSEFHLLYSSRHQDLIATNVV